MTLSPKRLSFDEMWKLYKLLGKATKDQEFLIDEVSAILDKLTPQEYRDSLLLMYGNLDFSKITAVDSVSLFIDGITKNGFFVFCDFTKGITK